MAGLDALRSDIDVATTIAVAQFRDLFRRNASTRREKALIGIVALFVLPIGLLLVRQAYAVGTMTRSGVDTPVLPVARNVLAPSMVIIAIFGGLGAAQSLARDSVRPLLLTSVPARAIVLGKVLYLLSTWLIPLLSTFILVSAYALGARTPLFILAAILATIPVLAVTMLLGMSLGYLLWLGVNSLGLSESVQRVVTASLSVVIFFGAFTIGILIGRAGGSGVEQLPTGDPRTPIGWYADLFFVGSPFAESIGGQTFLAAGLVVVAIPLLFAVLVRLAPRFWYASPTVDEDEEATSTAVPAFEQTPSELLSRTDDSLLGRSRTLRVTLGSLRSAYRSPDQFVYLFYYLFPVIGGLVSLAIDVPSALPTAGGAGLVVLGVWFAGGVFCLNPVGSEGAMLTQIVLAEAPAATFVHGRLIAGTGVGLALAMPGVVLFSLTAGFVRPATAVVGAVLVAAVVLTSAAVALGLGSVLPKFETVEVFDSVETLAPSRLAGLIHAGLTATLLGAAVAVTALITDLDVLSVPQQVGALAVLALVLGVLTDGSRRYAIARVRDHGKVVARTDRPFAIYASLGLAVLSLMVGQLVALAVVVGLGIDLPIELLLPLLFVIEYGGYALVAIGFLYVTHRGLAYLDLRHPTRTEVGYVAVGLLSSLAIWAVGLTAITELGLPAANHALFEPGEGGDATFLLVLIPLVLLINGPVEELLYRNVIQKYLDERFTGAVAIVVASALFALVHLPAYATAGLGAIAVTLGMLFVISCFWGVLYRNTESLFVPAAIHGLYNATLLAGLYASLVL